ncbi:MAG TPA: hypothetical protein VFR37_11050 [Longimicrobium sp.]|nr:hypothetical protein [Longimicrobium sp.]
MKKLLLDIDALEVESFELAADQLPRGTVYGLSEDETCGCNGDDDDIPPGDPWPSWGCSQQDSCNVCVSENGCYYIMTDFC